MDRREFLRAAGVTVGAAAVGGALAACGSSSSDKTTAGTGSATSVAAKPVRKVKLGFIALTDAASIIMAKELGFFANRSLDVEVIKQASWPATRDALQNGQIDGAHCLFGMPFSVATGVGKDPAGTGPRDLKIAMVLNQNGQAITLRKDLASAGYADLAKAKALIDSGEAPELAMTYPGGTHDMWLRYWLLATKADLSKVSIKPIPPPQMVQNMGPARAIQGYCVGEPWNAVAVQQDIGFTHLATQDLWQDHPEKALVVNANFAQTQTDTLKDVMLAVLDASKWLDDPANRSKAAETIGAPNYINAPPADIRGRLLGVYELGAGLGTRDFKGRQMQFFRDGNVNFPRRAHAIWFLAQYGRMGYLKTPPPYQQLADELILSDLYKEVAKSAGLSIPSDDMSPFQVKLDNVTFDPNKPEAEVSRK